MKHDNIKRDVWELDEDRRKKRKDDNNRRREREQKHAKTRQFYDHPAF